MRQEGDVQSCFTLYNAVRRFGAWKEGKARVEKEEREHGRYTPEQRYIWEQSQQAKREEGKADT